MSEKIGTCPVCGCKETSIDRRASTSSEFVECSCCGRFEISDFVIENNTVDIDKLASYLFYNGNLSQPLKGVNEKFFNFIGTKEKYDEKFEKYPYCYHVTNEIVENWYPKTFSDKVDKFLLCLAEKSHFLGDVANFTDEQLLSACFVNRHPLGPMVDILDTDFTQCHFLLEFLEENDYVTLSGTETVLSSKGWARIDELQKSDINNKNIFVSMSFDKSVEATRDAIRQGIIASGFSPEFIDEIIHNHQIMPEMFRLIRECKMLILEISDPNFGAYYEAGYALGLGKEVIICCNESVFVNKEITIKGKKITYKEKEKFGKYLLPHFDIAQKQILVWKNNEDLTKKLAEWIKALS